MNLSDIRTQVKLLVSWMTEDTDAAMTSRLTSFVDQGYRRIIDECPEALIPKILRYENPPQFVANGGAATGTTVAKTLDPWVMQFVGGTFGGPLDRTGDGTYHLYATLPSTGQEVRFQIRTFWTQPFTGERYFSLDRPWTFSDSTITQWKLRCPWLWLPANVTQVYDGQVYGSNGQVLSIRSAPIELRSGRWKNVNNQFAGVPALLHREQFYQQTSPNRAPVVSTDEGSWLGEPTGEFEYCYTYCWGYRSANNKSTGGNFIPLYESAASPVSSSVSSTPTAPIKVALPDIDWELNFNVLGTLRAGHSGVFKRLYRRRASVTGGLHQSIESPFVFQFLTDVPGPTTAFLDDGSVIPDYSLRLPEVHGYYSWDIWPEPDVRTEYELRCAVRPPPLVNDYDAPDIQPECIAALTFYAASFFARYDKDPDHARVLEDRAKQILQDFRQKYANPSGKVSRVTWDTGLSPGPLGWPRLRSTS